MIDKRFVSGAILVLTIVVAGASSLPALLLRPSAPEAMPAPVALSTIAKKPEPIADVKPAPERLETKPVMARVDPAPVPKVEPVSPPVALTPAPEAAVAVAPAAAPLAAVAAPVPPSPPEPAIAAEPAPKPAAVSFPPVQPVGVAAASGPDVVSAPATSIRPIRAEKLRQRTAYRAITRKRSVRPAIFPLREFLAWRR